MATSEERREVAARLRKTRGIMAFVDALGIDPDGDWCWTDVSRRVADLIDPMCTIDVMDTGERVDYECRERIMHCSNCSAEFGYVLYGEDGNVSMDDKPKFCPNCGGALHESTLGDSDATEERQRDAVEVVRCRDCKFYTPESMTREERGFGVYENVWEPGGCFNPERCSATWDSIAGQMVPVGIVTEPDGFCAWGRRADG